MKFTMIFLFSLLMFMPMSSVSGQTENDLTSIHSLESKSLIVLYTSKASIEKVNALKPVSNNTEEDASDYADAYDESVIAEFGSYMNPYNNYLKVMAPQDVVYTKVQLMDINTGVTLIKRSLKKDGGNSIDLSDAAPGTYILILTDDGRNIHSEEFSIF